MKKILLWLVLLVHLSASYGQQTFKLDNIQVNGSSQFLGSSTFSIRPTFNGNTPWDSGNFNPQGYATLNSPIFTGSVTIPGGSINGTTIGLTNPAAIVGTYVSGVGGSSPSTGISSVQNWVNSTIAYATFVDSSRTANNHIFNIGWGGSVATFGFTNDAFNGTTNFLTASGGFASGITGITSNSGSGTWAHTGAMSVSGAFSANTATFTAPLPVSSGGTGVISSTGTGSVVLSNSPTFAGTVGGANTIPLSILAQSSANTVIGNATNATANDTALPIPSCSGSTNALTWTTGTGFGCNTVASGTGQVNAGTSGQLTGYAATGNVVSGLPDLTFSAGALTHGVAGSVLGSDVYQNATTGSITVEPPTSGGLGSAVLTLPDVTDTLTANAATQTLSNKTLASPALSGTVTGNNTVPLSILSQNAANTVVGNATGGTANNVAMAMPSCSTAADALTWTAATGFTCNTAINATQLGGATPSTLNIGGTATTATNLVGGAANEVPYQTAANTTGFVAAPVSANTCLQYNGSILTWAACGSAGTGTVTSVNVSGGTTGLATSGGPVTTSGTITLGGTLSVANGGTGNVTAISHAVIAGNGTSPYVGIPPNTAGAVLIDQGAGNTPAFQVGDGYILTGADPTGVADSTAAIQTAVTNAVTGEYKLIIPPGTYKISSAINIPFGAGWKIQGASRGRTHIIQYGNNVPIFEFATASPSSSVGPYAWAITDLYLAYNTQQTSADPDGDAFFFTTANNTYFNCEISRIIFDNMFEGIAEDPTVQTSVWGCSIRDNIYDGDNTGSFLQLANSGSGQPNIEVDGAYISANAIIASQPVLDVVNNDSGSYNHLEVTNLLNGEDIVYMSGNGRIGNIKCETCTWDSGDFAYQFPNAHFTIGFMAIENATINATGSSATGIDVNAGGGASTVVVGNTYLQFASIAGTFYLANTGQTGTTGVGAPNYTLRFVNAPQGLIGTQNAFLTNIPGGTSDGGVSIDDWQQTRLTADNANNNATWSAGQPNVIFYTTPFTANHTVQVLDNDQSLNNSNMYNGLPLCVLRSSSATGAFTLTIENSVGTIIGQFGASTYGKICLIWNRTNGWEMTDYETWTGIP